MRKFLSLTLSLALLFASLPVSVFAGGGKRRLTDFNCADLNSMMKDSRHPNWLVNTDIWAMTNRYYSVYYCLSQNPDLFRKNKTTWINVWNNVHERVIEAARKKMQSTKNKSKDENKIVVNNAKTLFDVLKNIGYISRKNGFSMNTNLLTINKYGERIETPAAPVRNNRTGNTKPTPSHAKNEESDDEVIYIGGVMEEVVITAPAPAKKIQLEGMQIFGTAMLPKINLNNFDDSYIAAKNAAENEALMLSLEEVLPKYDDEPKDVKAATDKLGNALKNGKYDFIMQFIEKLAKNPKDISPSFIATSFMIFAESLKSDEINKIYKYISANYDDVIRFSAARALALYSSARVDLATGKVITNNPKGKFYFQMNQRREIASVLNKATCGEMAINSKLDESLYIAVVNDLSRVYDFGTGPLMFENAGAFLSCNNTTSGFNSFLEAAPLVMAIPYSAEAASAVAAVGAAEVLVAGSVIFIFFYALNDAYNFPTAIERLFRDFEASYRPSVSDEALEEYPAQTADYDYFIGAGAVNWDLSFTKYGDNAAAAANTSTCRQNPKPENSDCGNIKINDLNSRVSNSRDFVRRLKDYLKENGINFTKSTTIGELLRNPDFKGEYRDVLKLLEDKCDQYSNSKAPAGEESAYVKAYKVERGYIPEVEIKVDLVPNNISLKDIFSTSILNKICAATDFINGKVDRVDLGNGRSLRNTEHERNNNHIHYEYFRNGYLCNHSIDFDPSKGSFLKQIRNICKRRHEL